MERKEEESKGAGISVGQPGLHDLSKVRVDLHFESAGRAGQVGHLLWSVTAGRVRTGSGDLTCGSMVGLPGKIGGSVWSAWPV